MFRTLIAACFACLPLGAAAEMTLSFYGGIQESPHSRVYFDGDGTIPDQDFRVTWEGRSFEAPPYYGLRATWWRSESFGWGVDFMHAKVYAADETFNAIDPNFTRLEMTDGINALTVNAYRRWPNAWGDFTPYVGGGVGLSVPYVEVTYDGSVTEGYQVTGAAVTWLAGASYPIAEDWAVFGEYKGTFFQVDADLEDGGSFETEVITNALNLGVSFSF